LVIGYWLLVIGYWLLVIGYWLLVIGYWLPITQELDRLLVWETGDRASYSLESFEFDYCTKSDKK